MGMGRIAELAMGFPGYDARLPKSCALLPALLTPHGYAAYAVGKWHLTPEDEEHLGARRDRWPLGQGFERFYGFMGGESHQFSPVLVSDNHYVTPSRTIEDGYHLSEDLADTAIGYLADLRQVDHHKPWLLYFALGACHSPHQSPESWREQYRGRFDAGWDEWRAHTFERQKALGVIPAHTELSPRPDWVPAWRDLDGDEQRVYARYMEAFASFLSHADAQVGRLVEFVEAVGDLDNTVVMVLSDNGASSEGGPVGSLNDARVWNALPRTVAEAVERIDEIGGPRIHNNYPWGWTVAGNTPFKRWKRETHEGGVADPLIVHWPARVGDAGAVRRQYVHAIDVVPTLLEIIGIDAPVSVGGVLQRPVEGVSFAASLEDADAADLHTSQYYEMFGCRAMYHEGFKAVSFHEIQADEPGLDAAAWELYDLRADPSECHDLAAERPEQLAALDRSLVGRRLAAPGVAARQPAVLGSGARSTEPFRSDAWHDAVAGACTGSRGVRPRRAQPGAHDHRARHDPPPRHRRHATPGCARRAGIGARWVVAAPSRRWTALLRAQPVGMAHLPRRGPGRALVDPRRSHPGVRIRARRERRTPHGPFAGRRRRVRFR